MKRAGLALAAGVWVAGLLATHFLDFSKEPWSQLQLGGHTAASILLRLCSVPLRVWLVVFGLKWILNRPLPATDALKGNSWLLPLWCSVALYYIIDLLTEAHIPIEGKALAITALGILFTAGLLTQSTSFLGVTFSLVLASLILLAEMQDGANNAFTLFGLQGLALTIAAYWPEKARRSLYFVVITPALGYLFPFLEKLLLNPVGWLSGSTLSAYGLLFGYRLEPWQAIPLSLGLLAFQASMLMVLLRPRWTLFLYGAAIVFHLIAGLILHFQSALNPWIVSLLLAMAAEKSVRSSECRMLIGNS